MGLPIYGMVVDCVFYKSDRWHDEQLEAELMLPNIVGARYDTKKTFIVPHCVQGKAVVAPTRPPPTPWTRCDESDTVKVNRLRSRVSLHNILRLKGLGFDMSSLIMDFVGDHPFTWCAKEDIMKKLAIIIAANQGACVTGMPGTGKTKLLVELIRTWKSMDPETNIVCVAYTHAASRLMPGGRTLEHWRLKYARV